MPTIKLTAAAAERLSAPASGQIEYFDAAYPALALRVTASGVRSWVYFGRLHGRLKRVTLGRFPGLTLKRAREKAGETADQLRSGVDVTREKKAARREAARNTFESITAQWLKRDQAGNRSRAEVERTLNRDALPRWRGRPIETITRRDCIELLDTIVDRGAPVMARRLHAHLHRLFRWSLGRGIITHNPMADLDKPGTDKKRDRVLDDTELCEVWRATGALGHPFGELYRLLILTGARRDEIGALTWDEVDPERAEIRLGGARTKNNEEHIIPLSPPALEILRNLPHIEDKRGLARLVFTTSGETPVSGWTRAKTRLDGEITKRRREVAVKAGDDAESAKPLGGWRIHDLRRTVATGLQKLGVRLEVTEAVLGHTSGSRRGVVGVYQRHRYDPEKRAALNKWARHVMRLAEGGGTAKVVELRRPGESA